MGVDINEDSQSSEVTRGWGVLVALCLSPIFLLFACWGHYKEGLGAWACAGIIAVVAKSNWHLSEYRWFWIVIFLAVPAQIPFILFVPWDDTHLSYVSLLPVALLDYAVIYGAIKLGEMLSKRSGEDSPTS